MANEGDRSASVNRLSVCDVKSLQIEMAASIHLSKSHVASEMAGSLCNLHTGDTGMSVIWAVPRPRTEVVQQARPLNVVRAMIVPPSDPLL